MEHLEKTKKVIEAKKLMSFLVVVFLGIGMITSGLFGKTKLPGEIKVTIQENAIPGKPPGIDIVAVSKIPFKDGHIELTIPVIGNMPARKVLLWSGSSNTPVEKHLDYILPILPVGEFKIIGYFKFKSLREGARGMRVSKTLYINVHSDKILSSNISSRQIKRVELKNELEKKGHIESNIASRKSSEKNFTIDPKGDTPGNNKPQNKRIKTKKAPFVSTKKFGSVSGQTPGEKNNDNEKIYWKPSKIKKAPLVSSKKIISVSIQQDSIKKTGLMSKKAPHESTKKVVAISTGEEKEEKGSKSKSNNYSRSTEAQEKKKALKGGRK
jgi:hypothetical protein